jgi:hypothetical protein
MDRAQGPSERLFLHIVFDTLLRWHWLRRVCENKHAMATATVPTVTAMEAQAEASLFLSDRLPDRISASEPALDEAAQAWHVPVILAYPHLGVLGQIGEVVVSAITTEVISSTALEDMLTAAQLLAEQHRDAIEAPLP